MKRGTGRHPKVIHLRQLLKVGLATAVGYLELLWHFTAEFAPRGDIGKFDDDRIEAALDWRGKRGRLIAALTHSGWVDHHLESRLVVHDWPDHCEESVKKRLQRSGLKFVEVAPKVTGYRPDSGGETQDDGGNCLDMVRLPPPPPPPPPFPQTPTAAETAAAHSQDEDAIRIAAETFDLSDEERAEAWNETNGKPATATNGAAKRSLLNAEVETVLDQVARRMHGRHPAIRRCGIAEVKKLLRVIARKAPAAQRVELLHSIDQNHAAWCKTSDWQKDGGQYAKGLDNWLAPTKGRWNEPPAGMGPMEDSEPPRLMM